MNKQQLLLDIYSESKTGNGTFKVTSNKLVFTVINRCSPVIKRTTTNCDKIVFPENNTAGLYCADYGGARAGVSCYTGDNNDTSCYYCRVACACAQVVFIVDCCTREITTGHRPSLSAHCNY